MIKKKQKELLLSRKSKKKSAQGIIALMVVE